MDCEFTTTNYRKYRRNGNNQLPTLKYIYKRYIWPEFIKLLDGKKAKERKDIKYIRDKFCKDCAYYNDCEIDPDECKYYQNRKDYKLYQESWVNND